MLKQFKSAFYKVDFDAHSHKLVRKNFKIKLVRVYTHKVSRDPKHSGWIPEIPCWEPWKVLFTNIQFWDFGAFKPIAWIMIPN